MTKHVALQLHVPWISNEMNRVDQPITIEYKMVHDFNQAMFKNFKFEHFPILNFFSLWLSLEEVEDVTLTEKNWIISCNCKSEIINVCNPVEDHCLRAMQIVHHYANGCFDCLISAYQGVNPSREAISSQSGKYKRVTFVHAVVSVGPIKGVLSNSSSHIRAVISIW